MKKLIVGAIALFAVALPVSAATMRAGGDYTLSVNQTLSDNLYAAGRNVTIAGVVSGDAILAGNTVVMNGQVRNDLAAAGGTVQVLSSVTGDARVAGGEVTVGGRVGGDLIVAGGKVHVLQSAVINGDVIMAGGELTFDGVALKDVRLYGGSAVIRGVVSGSVTAKISQSVTVKTGASIKGNFDYTAPTAATIEQGAIISGKITASTTSATTDESARQILATLVSVALITKFIILALAAMILVYVFRQATAAIVARALSEIPKNTILGFAAFIALPIAAILLIVTVLFLPFGLLGLILYGLLLMLAKLYAGVITGALLSKWLRKEVLVTPLWALLGVAVLQLVGLVPIIGWIVTAIIFLMTFGAIGRILNDRYYVNR